MMSNALLNDSIVDCVLLKGVQVSPLSVDLNIPLPKKKAPLAEAELPSDSPDPAYQVSSLPTLGSCAKAVKL